MNKLFLMIAATVLTALLFSGCGFNAGSATLITERNIPEFNSVSVCTSSAQIEFVPSDQYGLEIFMPDRFKPTWEVVNGRLTILGETRSFFFDWNVRPHQYYVKVFYPTEARFSDITLKASSGDIRLPRVDVNDLSLTCSSGNVNANAENSAYVSIDVSSGDISFAGSGDNIRLTTKSGSIESDITNSGKIYADTSSGDIRINNTGDVATLLNANTSSGSIRVNGGIWRDAIAETRSGGVKITGELLGNTFVSTSSGSVVLDVLGDPSHYGYDLTPRSGSIHWDGQKMEKPARSSGSFDNHISANTSSGSIRVDFTN